MKQILRPPVVREVLKALAFLAIVLLVFSAFCRFFRFKYDDGLYNSEIFYKQEDHSVDVLVLGSSHAYQHIHTGVLYDDFGLTAFNLASGAQPIWTSYHYLIDALKTQTPKLVVLEGYMLGPVRDYRLEAWDVRSTFGFKPSLNWIENLKVAIPEDEF